MSTKRVFSRPRTKVYDANYNMGENYYKSALDGIDRKYGRVGSVESSTALGGLRASLDRERERPSEPIRSSAMRDLEADEFMDDFAKRKTQAASMLGEFDSLFESRMKNGVGNERTPSRAMRALEDEIEEDVSASMKRLKARAGLVGEERDDLESISKRGERSLRSKLDFSDKVMDSVGLSGRARSALEDEAVTGKRRVLKITATTTTESTDGGDNITRWTALKSGRKGTMLEGEDSAIADSAAAIRARKSRAMLDDIEAEMQAIAERGAAREKRVRDLKALVEENEANSMENLQSTMRVKNSLQSEKKMVSF